MPVRKMLLITGAAVLVGWPLAGQAGGQSGLYVGAGVGNARLEASADLPGGGEATVSGNDSAYKLILGYNFGWLPFLDLGLEGSYVDFGKASERVGGDKVTYEQTAFDGFGVAGVSFGPLGVFAKTGFITWNSEIDGPGFSRSDSSTDPAYGIGARIQVLSITGRLEYELFDLGGNKELEMTSLSALYTF
ncbi:outer membrane beta-barrel protein [Thiohalorhabdus methylotrophus]|uniref:Outer membrane beta-barrel protein n=1 Tax=Thiohalorhabdus methylotrophus TaxID=3242694 RepID=A0ABV4TVP3_9GAMM